MDPVELYFRHKIIGEGITFDDVLLTPAYSSVLPRDTVTETMFSRNVPMNIPLSSSAMDTVTESRLAIALAQEGGIGIIHRNLDAKDQVREVEKVKRSANGVILDPVCLSPDESIGAAKEVMETHNISGLPVTRGELLVGILTKRDLRFQESLETRISEVMTSEELVKAKVGTTLDEAKQILHERKVEKLLLVDESDVLRGLITIKDINKLAEFPNASRDKRGRLRVGAAVGAHDYDRVSALIEGGVDVLVVDTAHGHSERVLETVRSIKRKFEIDIVAGNVATADGAKALVDAGADGVKVGIGPGSICTTRVVTGVGVPQVTAIFNAVSAIRDSGVPIIADGGIRHSGDMVKAIACGASSVMLGSLFAGTDESPGETFLYQGRAFKALRGMGSVGAMIRGSSDRYGQAGASRDKLVPEGVEGQVPYKGALSDFVYQLVGGLRAGMGYCGCADIPSMQKDARFMRITGASLSESHPHDVFITKETTNYRRGE